MRHRSKLGIAFDLPRGWMVRVDREDRTVCSLVVHEHVEIPDLAPVIGLVSFQFTGDFGEWVARLMHRRGTRQPPLSVTVGGRPALTCDWTDGVADVYSAFVALATERGVEFEFSSRPPAASPRDVEDMGRAVLDSVRWLDGHTGA